MQTRIWKPEGPACGKPKSQRRRFQPSGRQILGWGMAESPQQKFTSPFIATQGMKEVCLPEWVQPRSPWGGKLLLHSLILSSGMSAHGMPEHPSLLGAGTPTTEHQPVCLKV